MTRAEKAELLERLAAETASQAPAVAAFRRSLEREEGELIWAEPQARRALRTVDEPSDLAQNWLAIVGAARRLGEK